MHFAQAVFGITYNHATLVIFAVCILCVMQYANVNEVQDSNYPHLSNCAAHCTVYFNMFELPFSVRIVCHDILYLFILFNISFLNRFFDWTAKSQHETAITTHFTSIMWHISEWNMIQENKSRMAIDFICW